MRPAPDARPSARRTRPKCSRLGRSVLIQRARTRPARPLLRAPGTDAVAERGLRVDLQIDFDLLPEAGVVAHLVAPRADRNHSLKRLDLGERLLELGHERVALVSRTPPFGER